MDEGLTIYEKMLEASDLVHSINMLQTFWVGLFLEAIIWRQEKAVEILGDLCRDVLEDRAWVDESILSKNLKLADIESQDVYNFLEYKEHVWAAIRQITAEIPVKNLKQKLVELTNSSTKHNDELQMIFNSFSACQSYLQRFIQNFTKRIDRIEASTLIGTIDVNYWVITPF